MHNAARDFASPRDSVHYMKTRYRSRNFIADLEFDFRQYATALGDMVQLSGARRLGRSEGSINGVSVVQRLEAIHVDLLIVLVYQVVGVDTRLLESRDEESRRNVGCRQSSLHPLDPSHCNFVERVGGMWLPSTPSDTLLSLAARTLAESSRIHRHMPRVNSIRGTGFRASHEACGLV